MSSEPFEQGLLFHLPVPAKKPEPEGPAPTYFVISIPLVGSPSFDEYPDAPSAIEACHLAVTDKFGGVYSGEIIMIKGWHILYTEPEMTVRFRDPSGEVGTLKVSDGDSSAPGGLMPVKHLPPPPEEAENPVE